MFHRDRCAALLFVLAIAGCGTSSTPQEPGAANAPVEPTFRLGMMPKLVGISYFTATEKGAREAAEELGVELQYDGPTEARSEDQERMINGWSAQGFDVVAVAPNDPEAISKTLANARQDGAIVLTWDTDANPEKSKRQVFVNQAPNEAIGKTLVDVMAEGLKAKGESLAGDYLIVSGTATASNQNTWMEYMRERIREKHPEMKLLPVLTPGEDFPKAREQTAVALSANPELKGIWGITSVSLPAAAKAVRDAGKGGTIYVTGLTLPSMVREYVEADVVEKFVLWDAVDLGYLTVHVAQRLHDGMLKPGVMDFGRLKGIEVREGEVILGDPLVFDKTNIEKYDF